MAYIPLKTGDKLLGVIVAQGKRTGAFSNEDFRVMRLVGEYLATLIENSRSEERYRAVVESALDGVLVARRRFDSPCAADRLARHARE